MFGFSKEAVRVKVKKCEGKFQPELRKFSVDPQITSLEVLQSILVKAFDIKSDFTLLYRTTDDCGQEIYLPLLSDWELDAAFLKAHNIAVTQRSEPCMQLRVDMKPFSEASEDWEPPYINPSSPALPLHRDQTIMAPLQQTEKQQDLQTGFQGLIMNQVERTFNMVSRALNLYDDPDAAPRPPLSDIEFRSFLDTVGQITNTSKLREVIYCGGIDPSLRKVVWKHILNIYPDGMTGKERMDYIKRKATEYYILRARWKDCVQKGMVNADLSYVTSMVKKDVLRTDRHHNFYAGSDDNQNIASLFNILTTYALNHPTVSYCQGMSDLASPLLVTMGDEAHAYICLCALMCRLKPNFMLDGEAMTLKFSHLTESLQLYDAEFYNYLKMQQADDLLFCYRWLLLEMKREFAFDDALTMLEVLWASLPHKSVTTELLLIEREFDPMANFEHGEPPPVSPLIKTHRENAYTKVCAMRRQSSSFSLANVKAPKLSTSNQINLSLDECSTENKPLQHSSDFQSLDDSTEKNTNMERDNKNVQEIKNNRIPHTNKLHENGRRTKEAVTWSSATNLTNGNSQEGKDTPLGNQIRMLRDKISLHNNKFFTSLDSSLDADDPARNPKVKMVKNLNEFLTLASTNKPAAPRKEKLERAKSVIVKTSPKNCPDITFSKTSFDENDLTAHKLYKDLKALNKTNNSDESSPDDSQEYYPMTTSVTRELRLELEHLDRQVFGTTYLGPPTQDSTSESTSSDDKPLPAKLDAIRQSLEASQIVKKPLPDNVRPAAKSAEDIYLWENPLHRNTPTTKTASSCPQTPDEQAELDFDADNAEIMAIDADNLRQESVDDKNERQDPVSKSQKFFSSMSQELENAKRSCESLLISKQNTNFQSVATTINNFQKKYEALRPQMAPRSSISSEGILPPPTEFGAGNPFLMFLCLSVLMQHRDYIMRNRMDYNELAMHFDKMVRKHNVHRVLNQARQMYALYLKQYACDNHTA